MSTLLRDPAVIIPDWPAPERVRSLVTTRKGGFSSGPHASFNLGASSGDVPEAVTRNRALLRQLVPAEPLWLNQVHGIAVIDGDNVVVPSPGDTGVIVGDAAVVHQPRRVCAVLSADCLPLLLCDRGGEAVGAAHAGWRGLAAGIVEKAVSALGCPPEQIMAWLGPAIGPAIYEVGEEVRDAFMRHDGAAARAFSPNRSGKFLADLYSLARQRLAGVGVASVHGGGLCTYADSGRFFSHRRDGVTGRMASLVWIA